MIPTREQCIDAISNGTNVATPLLEGYSCVQIQRGNYTVPLCTTGGFGMVFQMRKGDTRKAVKVWLRDISDIKERMQMVSEYLGQHNMPYFVQYNFCENGLRIEDSSTDILIMEWADGLDLKAYLESVFDSGKGEQDIREKIGRLENSLKECFLSLHSNHISHGDLQHANIFISESPDGQINIKLIDYDSLCVPKVSGKPQVTSGYSGYQHPQRISDSVTLKSSEIDDNFSEKIIIASLQLLQAKPSLWNEREVDRLSNEEGLLFRDSDFVSFRNCHLYRSGQDTLAKSILEDIANDLEKDISEIKPFNWNDEEQDDDGIEIILNRLLFQLEECTRRYRFGNITALKGRISELSNQLDPNKRARIIDRMNNILGIGMFNRR